ncbi:MAG TPA: GNAT family N-acetyltransferase [Pyrinomonadaceae bacterium]|nr:GNAT family N-acetyltransferase [Pyrinomonadaceae bacterium]
MENIIFSDRNLARQLERTEASNSARFVEARRQLFPESGAEWIEVGGAYAMFDGTESPLTQTFGLGMFEEATNGHLETLENFFKERGAPVFHEISPMADLSLLSLLKERGYYPIELTSVMYRPIEREINLGLMLNPQIKTRIIEAGEEKFWAETAARGWSTEAPGLSEFMLDLGQVTARSALPFLAELNEKPIAAGVLSINKDVALLAGAATVPEGRRQGAQLALLNSRLQYAAEHGCTIAMMCALPGSQSQRNAEKHGFRIAYTRIKWQLDN